MDGYQLFTITEEAVSMRQIVANRFFETHVFGTFAELSRFTERVGSPADLWLDDSVGEKYICCLWRSSLTSEALFSISFCSDAEVDKLRLLYWQESKLIIMESSNWVYLINEDLRIVKAVDISFAVQGFYITDGNHLLILEETAVKVVDYEGNLLLEKHFGLIEDFSIDGNELTIKLDVGEEVVLLPI